ILRSSLENAQMPVITDQYVSGWVLKNSSAELYVTAAVTDGGMLTYQWYGSGDGTDFGPISGAVSETYDAPTGTIGWRYYYVIVTNTIDDNYDGGIKTKEVKSDVIALKVNDAAAVDADVPDITSQPVGGSVNQNAVKVLTVEASVTDGGTLTYQWYSIDTPVAGATGTSYTVPTDVTGTLYYYVVVTNTNTGADGNNTAASTSKIVMIKVTDTPDNDDSGGLPLALIAGAAIAAIIAIAAVVYYLFIRRP
ncbi:MAG: hypothetical protein FWG58_02600, partial [Methanomassiliicoccaceae archaeon]|nr:hypothetical protein [Methanomassiliicoccaceae archaeon]